MSSVIKFKKSKRQERRKRKKQVENIIKYHTPSSSNIQLPIALNPSSSNISVNKLPIEMDHNKVHTSEVDMQPYTSIQHENVALSDIESEPENSDSPCDMFEHFSDFSSNSSNTFEQNCTTNSNLSNTFEQNCTTYSKELISQNFLKTWALNYNVTHSALSALLCWFQTNPTITNLPKDARTLLNTPKKNNIEKMGKGEFYYFGILNSLLARISKPELENIDTLFLDFNIDGIPLHKSTQTSFWPILCLVRNLKTMPFPVAIYCGAGKPPLEEFFKDFVLELKLYLDCGIFLFGKQIRVSCRSFCCDTPARAYVKGTQSHNSYMGCDKCCVRGEYVKHRVVFPNIKAPLRNDVDFHAKKYGDYHKTISPLTELGIGLVSLFPVDYMHSVCLGVVRKLLNEWRTGNRFLHRFEPAKLAILEIRIRNISEGHYWPSEIVRKPRSISQLDHWKAIEFQNFLLYISPLLKDILRTNIFCNFMLLHFAITILLNENLNNTYNGYAKSLLELFVKNVIQIYGKEFCVYNVHSLIHLSSDAKSYGSLNGINCYIFENYLGFLKRSLRKSNQNLQQIVNRIIEGRKMQTAKKLCNEISVIGKKINQNDQKSFYKKINFYGYVISTKSGDNCIFLKNQEIMLVKSIYTDLGNIFLSGVIFKDRKAFLSYPADSSIISLFEVSLGKESVTVSVTDLDKKAILLPWTDDRFICTPFVNCL